MLALDEAAAIVAGICQVRVFRTRMFPRACLRQSLTLYRALARLGYPVVIHFGVLKDDATFRGHSWVTVNGRPVVETVPSENFTQVYSYASG